MTKNEMKVQIEQALGAMSEYVKRASRHKIGDIAATSNYPEVRKLHSIMQKTFNQFTETVLEIKKSVPQDAWDNYKALGITGLSEQIALEEAIDDLNNFITLGLNEYFPKPPKKLDRVKEQKA